HTWAFGANPGNTVFLEPDGTLLRTKQTPGGVTIGGYGGGVMRAAFDGSLSWDFSMNDAAQQQHHNALAMPNGNVLMIAWQKQSAADAVAAGRNPASLGSSAWLPDSIVEIQQTGPTTGVEVWRWNSMDHLVQDFDATKPNFGVVADNPQRIDINYPHTTSGNGDWMHANSLSYDEALDQILISVPNHDEFWILDHSTTTAEAAGSTGGNSGMGGDLLYRWGNPAAYDRGTPANKQLHNQHGVMFIEPGRPGAGNVLIFNNQVPGPPQHSEIWEIARQADGTGAYPTLAAGVPHGPAAPAWSYVAPNPTDLNSGFLSSAQRMPNGNTLICSGAQGEFTEVTSAGAIVWSYTNTLPATGFKYVFQNRRYEHYLWCDTSELSAAAGGTIGFDLVCGSGYGGELYLLLGSFGGTTPGIPVDGELLPLAAPDLYFDLTLTSANQGPFSGTFGALDALGRASASITVPAGVATAAVGLVVNHAFVVLDPVTLQASLASNAAALTVTP
ncbi:MAG: aryl-sulfate sulfotransferase, partial [Planctomycetota bacterium]|nr:aryl-sulfate sulfotransferase [Planctomycetota bacterium]